VSARDCENRIEWLYGAGGGKLRKTVVEDGAVTIVKDYSSGYVYTNEALDYFRSENGRIRKTASGYTPEYHLTDHLGNVRVAFEPNGSGGLTRTQEQHYYPFGMELQGLSYDGGLDNEYRYNGKEHEKEHELHWYHYGARYYDPQLGRWHAVDPQSTKMPRHGPYAYCLNNPIDLVDPSGKEPTKDRVGILGHVTSRLMGYRGNSIETLSWASKYETFGHASEKYLYTTKYGYIDLTHFFRAASIQHTTNEASRALSYEDYGLGGVLGYFVFETLGLKKLIVDGIGIANEFDQAFDDNIRRRHSAFSSEDIPSNSAGIEFAKSYDPSKPLYKQFREFMENAGVKDLDEIRNEEHFKELINSTSEAEDNYDENSPF
jgi:RHS repeat-associated protein